MFIEVERNLSIAGHLDPSLLLGILHIPLGPLYTPFVFSLPLYLLPKAWRQTTILLAREDWRRLSVLFFTLLGLDP